MNFAIKIFLLGILLTPIIFASGEVDRNHPRNCDEHHFIVKYWQSSDTWGPNDIERLTAFRISYHTWRKSVTYRTKSGDDCTFLESGIIESCQKLDKESFDEGHFSGPIVLQNMALKVHHIKHSFPVAECKEYFYGESDHVVHPPYRHMEILSLHRTMDTVSLFIRGQIFH